MPVSGIALTRDGKTVATDHASAARKLVGTGIWVAPVDLSTEPDEIKALLAKQVPTEPESPMLRQRFTLSREALLETIARAGGMPEAIRSRRRRKAQGDGEAVRPVQRTDAHASRLALSFAVRRCGR